MTTSQRHAEKVVLVTGAASGIGAAISEQYAREGAVLGLVDIQPEALQKQADLLRTTGATVVTATADVADYESCKAAHERVVTQIDRPIDILINNAGISPKVDGKPANFWEMDPQEWLRVVGVNLNGAFNWARLVTPAMVARREGRIINMSSVAAKFFVAFTAAHYGTTNSAPTESQ